MRRSKPALHITIGSSEARGANPAFDAYFDAVVNDLEPLVRWFKDGCDLAATRLELLHISRSPVQGEERCGRSS